MFEVLLSSRHENGCHRIRPGRFALTRYLLLLALLLAGSRQSVLAQFDFGGFGGRGKSEAKVTVESQFTPATADRPALLFVTATIADGFHVYATDQSVLPEGGGGPLATQITLSPDSGVQLIGEWQPTNSPDTHIDKEIWTGLELREHSKQVTWFAPIRFAAGVKLGSLTITGKIEGQACNPQTCIPFEHDLAAELGEGVALPPGVKFSSSAFLTAKTQAVVGTSPRQQRSQSATPRQAAPASVSSPAPLSSNLYDLSQVSLATAKEGSVVYYLITAFFGGLILNIMPCVLPVIGLKVMSFVQQAGQSRAHAWALNCWYSAGIIAVFLALAGLAVTFQLSWGTQFSNSGFNIALIGIVFAMALSLLGMWDIPIPGFVGSSAAVEVTEREGPTAAFLKGILTTLLATPCTGPFMVPALTWALKQPAWLTISVFGVLGLGMASPYLLIGAFPNLIRFLPKPGAWMETFKKIMGLVLLATVVWLLTSVDMPLVVPTVALMVGIAAACWWISQTPITAPIDQKAYGWVTALMIVVIAAMSSYGWLYRDVMKPRYEKRIAKYAEEQIGKHRLQIAERLNLIAGNLQSVDGDQQLHELIDQLAAQSAGANDEDWQSFSLAKLGQLTLGEGRTVLVDFTADWCATCKVLERLVLHTQSVEEAITQADVVTMEADYTKRPSEIERAIKSLGGVGVPLIAIFPGDDPYRPYVFSDGQYTKVGLIEAIAQATGRDDLIPGDLKQGKSVSGAALSQAGTDEARR